MDNDRSGKALVKDSCVTEDETSPRTAAEENGKAQGERGTDPTLAKWVEFSHLAKMPRTARVAPGGDGTGVAAPQRATRPSLRSGRWAEANREAFGLGVGVSTPPAGHERRTRETCRWIDFHRQATTNGPVALLFF
jgi:hypothetical protein